MLAEVNGLGVGFPVYSLGPTILASEILEVLSPKLRFPFWHRFFQTVCFPRI